MVLERIYTIPIRREWEKAPRYKRAKKAVKAVKEFLAQHMNVYDRDLKKIKIERWLNMALWSRGIKHPPARIKVKAVKDGDIVRAELADLPKRAFKEQEKKEKAAAKTTKATKSPEKNKETKAEKEEHSEEKSEANEKESKENKSKK